MLLAGITLGLIGVGFVAFIIGSILVSKYAFRVSTGLGLAVLLVPPYTFYFAFFELEEDDKAFPVATWLFGLFVTTLLTIVFLPTLQHFANGEWEELKVKDGPVESMASESSDSDKNADKDDESGGAAGGEADRDEADGDEAGGDDADQGDDAKAKGDEGDDDTNDGETDDAGGSSDDEEADEESG